MRPITLKYSARGKRLKIGICTDLVRTYIFINFYPSLSRYNLKFERKASVPSVEGGEKIETRIEEVSEDLETHEEVAEDHEHGGVDKVAEEDDEFSEAVEESVNLNDSQAMELVEILNKLESRAPIVTDSGDKSGVNVSGSMTTSSPVLAHSASQTES